MSSLYNEPAEGEHDQDGERDDGQELTRPAPDWERRLVRAGAALLVLLIVFALGVGAGYLRWGGRPPAALPANAAAPIAEQQQTAEEAILPASYTLPVSYGDLGPQLLAAGAIDQEEFVQIFAEGSQPLTDEQLATLTEGISDPIAITPHNSHFLLNFFWALGLANKNPILDEGAMVQYGGPDKVGNLASTAGWTLGVKPAMDLYSKVPILALTAEQQARVEEVAKAVYRPCCNNPTSFPDCNHGMAMLGLLELMAARDATVDQMFEAAKYVNAFWFPQQTAEMVVFLRAKEGLDFAQIDARRLVGGDFSSAPGFSVIHQQLQQEGLLEQVPKGGNSCGV
jgi:hypothetical protein